MRADERIVGAGGVVAGAAALVASSCCAVPLALSALGVGSSGLALLDPVQHFRTPLLLIALGLVGWGWWSIYRGARSRFALAMLMLATALVVGALAWSLWEPSAVRALLK